MRTAFITGASGGIGSAIALRLAEDGFALACCCHSNKESAERLASELEKMHATYKMYFFDVSDTTETEKIFREASAFFGGFSVLVNCAGIALRKLFTDTSPEEFDRICAVNLKGVYNTCRVAVPEMVRRHEGKIINISSMWGVCGASCEAVYSASKAAVIGFTKALARELAPSNIQVNCIAPGAIDTVMNSDLTDDEKSAFAEEIPMGRFGSPAEIAGVVSFLAGKDSSYITAQVITADGGLT
jgi:3-oxoacyl-[acyl-carrier protein] reductase